MLARFSPLVLTLLVAANASAESCRIQFAKITAHTKNSVRLAIGTPVKAEIDGLQGKTKVKGFFIGRRQETDALTHEKTDRLYFAESDGKIFSVETSDTKLLDRGGKALSADDAYSFRIDHQDYMGCSLYATTNCVGFLKQNRILSADNSIYGASQDSLLRFFEDLHSRNQVARIAEAERQNAGLTPFQRAFRGARPEPVPRLRQRLLAYWQLPAKILPDTKRRALMRHLLKGYPAILDVDVAVGEHAHNWVGPGGMMLPRVGQAAVPGGKGATDSHTVLAIGIVKTGWFARKVVILDSDTAEVSLWNLRDLGRSTGGKATLVFPNEDAYRAAFKKD